MRVNKGLRMFLCFFGLALLTPWPGLMAAQEELRVTIAVPSSIQNIWEKVVRAREVFFEKTVHFFASVGETAKKRNSILKEELAKEKDEMREDLMKLIQFVRQKLKKD